MTTTAKPKSTKPPKAQGAWWATAAAPATVDDGIQNISGLAWSFALPPTGDRGGRVIEPGAFGNVPFTVPLLAYHFMDMPIGSAVMTPTPQGLAYQANFAQGVQAVDDIRALIKAKAIPAVSIGWIDEAGTSYWSADFETLTFPDATVVELSVVPVPANPLVTLEAAGFNMGKRMTTASLIEVYQAIGKRNNADDATSIQSIHDTTVGLGATCNNDEGGDTEDDDEDESASLAWLEVARRQAEALEI